MFVTSHGKKKWLVIAMVAVFLFIASFNISLPGLYYDEVLFLNAAMGGQADLFIHKRIFDVPVMLMPYIGALKAWLYYLIFNLFDVSVLSIRLPVILIGAATLWINYRYVRIAFGAIPSLIFVALAAVEPSTLFHTRLDWGPTTLMMLFRGLLLVSIALWIATGERKHLIAAATYSIFGIFDKLNFIWICSAAIVAVIVVYQDRVIGISKPLLKLKLPILLSATIVGAFVLTRLLQGSLVNEVGVDDFFVRMAYVVNLMAKTIAGTGVYDFVVGGQPNAANHQLPIILLVMLISLFGLVYGITKNQVKIQPILFFVIFVIIILAQIFITKKATGPHHAAMIAPLWLIPISVGLGSLTNLKTPKNLNYGLVIVILSVALLVVSSLRVAYDYHAGFKGKVNPQWDVASTELVKEISTHISRPIVSVDWGTATIVQGLLQNKLKVFDFWPWFKDGFGGKDLDWFEREFVNKGGVFIVSSPGREAFPDTRRNFLALIKERKWNVVHRDVVNDSQGNSLFEIYYADE
jgi:hypothetical protein